MRHPGRQYAVGAVQYFTNEVIARQPSLRLRTLWYRRVLGIEMGEGSAIHRNSFIWFDSVGQLSRERRLRIGRHTWVSRGCVLDPRFGIRIGDNVSISPDASIVTARHGIEDPEFPVVGEPVEIEDHVWIAYRAMIMPGVRIGRAAVVAAGAIVTRDVAPGCVVAGSPARPVGRRTLDPDYQLADPMLPFA